MRGATQLTLNFKDDYNLNYPNYKMYIKGFAFGHSSNFTGDYNGSDERVGDTPTWSDVNQTSYKEQFYVGQIDDMEGVTLNWGKKYSQTGQPDRYADKEDNISLRFSIPHLLEDGSGDPFEFDFDEIYIFFALYDPSLTYENDWNSVTKSFPGEIVHFGFYVNVFNNNSTDVISYHGKSLNKYAFELNIGLLNIYQRMEMRRLEYLDPYGFNDPNTYLNPTSPVDSKLYFENIDTPAVTHAKLTFQSPVTYSINDTINISDVGDTVTYTFRVSEVIDNTTLIIDGTESSITAIQDTTYKENDTDILIDEKDLNINYYPLYPLINNIYTYDDFSFYGLTFNEKRYMVEFSSNVSYTEGSSQTITKTDDTESITIDIIKKFSNTNYLIEVDTADLSNFETNNWKDDSTNITISTKRSYSDLKDLFYKLFGEVTEVQLHTFAWDMVKTTKDFYDSFSNVNDYSQTINSMVKLYGKTKEQLQSYFESEKSEVFKNPYHFSELTLDEKTLYGDYIETFERIKLETSSTVSAYNVEVDYLSDSNIDLNYSSHIQLNIDGENLDAINLNELFLFINQTDSKDNGIYELTDYYVKGDTINEVLIDNAGTGYVVGDVLTNTGTNEDVEIKITEVDTGGEILDYIIVNGGDGYTASTTISMSGGSGSGAQFYIVSVVYTGIHNYTFERNSNFNDNTNYFYGLSIYIFSGTTYSGKRYVLKTESPDIITTPTNMIFEENDEILVVTDSESSPSRHLTKIIEYPTNSIIIETSKDDINYIDDTSIIENFTSSDRTFTSYKRFKKVIFEDYTQYSVGTTLTLEDFSAGTSTWYVKYKSDHIHILEPDSMSDFSNISRGWTVHGTPEILITSVQDYDFSIKILDDSELSFLYNYIDGQKRVLLDISDMNSELDIEDSVLYDIVNSSGNVDVSVETYVLNINFESWNNDFNPFYIEIRDSDYNFIAKQIITEKSYTEVQWNENFVYLLSLDENNIYSNKIPFNKMNIKRNLKYRTISL